MGNFEPLVYNQQQICNNLYVNFNIEKIWGMSMSNSLNYFEILYSRSAGEGGEGLIVQHTPLVRKAGIVSISIIYFFHQQHNNLSFWFAQVITKFFNIKPCFCFNLLFNFLEVQVDVLYLPRLVNMLWIFDGIFELQKL